VLATEKGDDLDRSLLAPQCRGRAPSIRLLFGVVNWHRHSMLRDEVESANFEVVERVRVLGDPVGAVRQDSAAGAVLLTLPTGGGAAHFKGSGRGA
jgi:hypothetical protein